MKRLQDQQKNVKKRKEILRIDEVASWLSISDRQVYRLISNGEIEAFKIRSSLRIRSKSVSEYIRRQVRDFQNELYGL
ncbi:MAG: helix-turn-helix domain-containing protein [bacterium]|nr:MAG: helix-turn-helix domain-containing protein [bacterium]